MIQLRVGQDKTHIIFKLNDAISALKDIRSTPVPYDEHNSSIIAADPSCNINFLNSKLNQELQLNPARIMWPVASKSTRRAIKNACWMTGMHSVVGDNVNHFSKPTLVDLADLVIFTIKTSMKDVDPIYNSGSPKFLTGLRTAASLCEMLEIDLNLFSQSAITLHGLNDNWLNRKPVMTIWKLVVNYIYIYMNTTSIWFAVLDGDAPIIIVLDIAKYMIHNNRLHPSFISFERPTDKVFRMFST